MDGHAAEEPPRTHGQSILVTAARGDGALAGTGVAVEAEAIPLAEAVERARVVEKLGFGSVWVGQQIGERDAAVLLAAYAASTNRVGLGAGILPIYPRHPADLAQMAATLDELSGGRLMLGLGLGHQLTNEWMLGLPMGDPLTAMREYVTIVRTMLAEGKADLSGERFSARTSYGPPRRERLPVVLGGLRPRMLRLAAELADGVVLWLCAPSYVRDLVIPTLRAVRAGLGLGMEGFAVISIVPVCITATPTEDRNRFRRTIASFGRLPYYRRMLEASGFGSQLASGQIDDMMIDQLGGVGGEEHARGLFAAYREAGCTLVVGIPVHSAQLDHQRFVHTMEGLASG
jgi:F420-dependent oxidoreductase-like protein